MTNDLILVIDFGGQYNQLIARRVRDNNVYCEIAPYTITLEEIKQKNPKGIIFTGGPNSVYKADSPVYSKEIFSLGIPILGLCYGAQLVAFLMGGEVTTADISEYGKTTTEFKESVLFKGLPDKGITWMSHTDRVYALPEGFTQTASTKDCPFAGFENKNINIYALQFHPEVMHTENGSKILANFLFEVCKVTADWNMESYAKEAIANIKEQVGDKKVLLALSGGVDSAVCAALISKAIGNNLTCVFIDHGLMRLNEGDEIEAYFGNIDLNFKRINAGERFLGHLKGVTEPEAKRKVIGEQFVRVFEEIGKEIQSVDFLAQGTIYPDIVESGVGESAVIKSHHNVGGLPDFIEFEGLVEPLKMLFKDEVRKLGLTLGLPEHIVWRQPFPGPGLGIRVIGEVTAEKVALLQKADFIFRDELDKAGIAKGINQYFAVLTNMKTVGVKGDFRVYDYVLALRAVTTDDFMTADFSKIDYEILENISAKIMNSVQGISRIVYDITTKPPATIEWE